MTEQEILKNLAEIKEEFTWPGAKMNVEGWQTKIKNAIIRQGLEKSDGIKELIQRLKEKIQKINVLLQHDREMAEDQRARLFIQKDLCNWHLWFYEEPGKVMKGVEKFIKDNKPTEK